MTLLTEGLSKGLRNEFKIFVTAINEAIVELEIYAPLQNSFSLQSCSRAGRLVRGRRYWAHIM